MIVRRFTRVAAAVLLIPLSACSSLSAGFLAAPAGATAELEHHEFILVAALLVFVWVPVFILVPLFAWHYRISNTHAAFRPQWGFNWGLEALIWLPPTLLVVILSVFLVRYTVRLDPYRPLAGNGAPVQIDVVALDWKWLFLYPAQNIATVNQLVLPAGRPVTFQLTSGTVMQSLLMPRLAGQIFAMNGMKTQLNFAIDRPGTYEGENTQYNGDGFHDDKFTIEAMPQAGFDKWIAAAQAQPARLDAAGYSALSVRSVLKAPLLFGHFEPDLFQRILGQRVTPGYLAQQHAAASHG